MDHNEPMKHLASAIFPFSRITVLSILALVFGLAPQNVSAQSYNARTDVTPQAYPGTIPCPYNGTGCKAGNGSLTGQNYCFTPSDFATQICRATDVNSGGSQMDYGADCGGSAEANIMDSSDTRVVACTGGNVPIVLSFNLGTRAFATLYPKQGPSSDGMLGGCSSSATYVTTSPFFSFTQPYIGYAESFNSSGNQAICQWNFTSTSAMPTYSNGGVTQIVDLSTCAPALAGVGYGTYTDDVTVSSDDQTFAAVGSTTAGQGSSGVVYVVAWNRTNGCRVWRTDTGVVTGAWGATGSISLTDRFYIHNVRLSKGGQYVKVTTNTCTSSPGGCTDNTNTYIWNISTLTVTRIVNDGTDGCGHNAIGYLNTINLCSGFWIRPFTSNDTSGTVALKTYPNPNSNEDGHASFNSGNTTDTNLVFWSLYTGTFGATNAWDNEIIGVRLDGSGVAYRFAHSYITGQSGDFGTKYGIGNTSADGKYYIWPSDWDGMLGALGGGSNSCTIGTNCRSDLFVAVLPLSTSTALAPPISLRATVN